MNTRTHQTTFDISQQAGNAVNRAVGDFKQGMDTVRTTAVDAAQAALHATKMVLAEAGVLRVMVQRFGTVRDNDRTVDLPPQHAAISVGMSSYTAATAYKRTAEDVAVLEGRDTPVFDNVFSCGDYWLPLSLQFSVNASKVLDNCQLVDGPNITQRVTRSPKTVNVSFALERKQERTPDTSYVEAMSIRYARAESEEKRAVYKLTKFLMDLFENNDVFAVENPVLNDEIGMSWAVMTSYRFAPSIGSTFGSVSFTLQEVNVSDPLLYQSDIDTSGGIPTTKIQRTEGIGATAEF